MNEAKAYKQAQKQAIKAKEDNQKAMKKLLESKGVKIEGWWNAPTSLEEAQKWYPDYFNINYEYPSWESLQPGGVSVKASTPEVQAISDALRQAYESWRAANKGQAGKVYDLAAQKKYLPAGVKIPSWDWKKSKAAGTDAWDPLYGTIIPRSSMAPSWIGDAMQAGQFVAPSVLAAASGMTPPPPDTPKDYYDKANPSGYYANKNPLSQIPTSVIANTNQQQASSNLQVPSVQLPKSITGTFQTQGGLFGQSAIAAEDTGKTPSWMDNIYNTKPNASWKELFG